MIWSALILLAVFSVGLFVGGYLAGLPIIGVLVGIVFVPRFRRVAKDPLRIAAILLALTPVLFASGLILGSWMENDLILYFLVFFSGVVSYWPVIVSIGLFQLWWNPGKYKERQTKQARRERKLESEFDLSENSDD